MAYIVLAALFLSGCFFETSDDLPFGIESTEELPEEITPLYRAEDVPTGMVCVHDFAEGGACDPVLQDCGEDRYCSLAFDTQIGRARAVCKAVPSLEMTGVQGDTCDGVCAVGFLCVSQVCRRLCELKSGFGCEENQFCDDPFVGTHGVCSPQCR